MASAYTQLLRITLPTIGELDGTWGTVVNTGTYQLLEDALAATAAVTHDDSASYTLTAASGSTDEARDMFLNVSGTITAARNVVCPTKSKLYFIRNNTTGGYAITLKTSGGTGISVANGEYAMLYCDGTNVVNAVSVTGTGSYVKANSPTISSPAFGNTSLGGIKVASFNSQVANATTTGAVTIDWTAGQNQKQNEPTGAITYTFTAPPGPCHLQLLIDSDGSSTAQTITWPGTVIWYGATYAGVPNKKVFVNFWYDGTNYHGTYMSQV